MSVWFRHARAIALAVVWVALPARLVTAQPADTAIVVGTVLDSDNAPIPGASVTVINQTTNVTTSVVTNERGQYRTPPLRIGSYDVVAELSGFKRSERRGIVLRIGDVRNVDAVLAVGELAETITVEASTPVLNTSDSTVGTVITNDHITALPLNGRNYLQLASLSAGTGPQTNVGISIGGQAGRFCSTGRTTTNRRSSPPTAVRRK